jgi:chromosome segregation ATPase
MTNLFLYLLAGAFACRWFYWRGRRSGESLEQRVDQLEEEQKKLMSIADELKTTVDRVEKEAAETAANTTLLRSAVADTRAIVATLEARVAELEGQIDPALPGELADIKARLDTVAGNLNADQTEAGTVG